MTIGPKIPGAVIPRTVFTQPGSKREAAPFGPMSAPTSDVQPHYVREAPLYRSDLQPTDYSITSSARPDRGKGTLMQSDLVVLRLRNISSFVDCWTGRSVGFSPLRTRPA